MFWLIVGRLSTSAECFFPVFLLHNAHDGNHSPSLNRSFPLFPHLICPLSSTFERLGRGYCLESHLYGLAYGFEVLGLTSIIFSTDELNMQMRGFLEAVSSSTFGVVMPCGWFPWKQSDLSDLKGSLVFCLCFTKAAKWEYIVHLSIHACTRCHCEHSQHNAVAHN